MTTRFIQAVTLLACALCSTVALAEPPARVGRVSLSQGEVGISGEVGDPPGAALVNWPVTSHNVLTTGRGARTEIRIGSTSIRLDGDSSLEVSELDDERLRLRLHYGSVSLRIANAETLAGFELATSNARVRLQQPGWLRVDAERIDGASAISVFDGVALVEDRGTQLIVRAGRRADVRADDVRTGLAARDSFDDWSQQRDQRADRSPSARYVGSEMTGYEDLDRNGVWRDDPEYGPLWQPSAVAAGWAPYRDGSWSWIAPWGWTWVDNAAWGYAPFHYGRWVQASGRWAWAPGRQVGRPVWAPALVGWVGGSTWRQNFGAGGDRPAQGWYPLTPRDAFVPGYRLSQQHLQQINRDARPEWRADARNDRQPPGLTVLPHAQFGQRGTAAVRAAPRGDDRFDRDFNQRNLQHRPELSGAPAPLAIPAAAAGPAPLPSPPPSPSPSPFTGRDGRPGFDDYRQRPQQAAPARLANPANPASPQPEPNRPDAGLNRLDFRRDNRSDVDERRQRLAPARDQDQAPRGRVPGSDGERRLQPEAGAVPPPAMPRQAPQPAPAMAMPPPMLRHAPQPAAQPAAAEPAPRAVRGDNKRGEER